MAGLIALSAVVACSDDTSSSPATEPDASPDASTPADSGPDAADSAADVSKTDAPANDTGTDTGTGSDSSGDVATGMDGATEGSTGTGDGAADAAHDGTTGTSDGSSAEAASGDGGGDATLDGGSDAAMVDGGGDSTVMDGSSDAPSGDAQSDASDAAVVPVLDCTTFAAASDGGGPCELVTSGIGWQLYSQALADGGSPATLTLSTAADASTGALDLMVPFTGPGQTAQVRLWVGNPPVLNVANKTLTLTVAGLVPVTNDPNNPGTWDLWLQSALSPDGGAAWPETWIVATWTSAGILTTPDGGATAYQTLVYDLTDAVAGNVDLTQVIQIGFDLNAPAAVDAGGATFSTANVLFQSVTIE
jgi:hypothetical protein